jgi:voltage-gated potassium channel
MPVQEPTQTKSKHRGHLPVPKVLARIGVWRFSSIELLVVLVLWLISSPLVMQINHGDLVESVVATVVMLSAILSVGGRRRAMIAGICLVMPPLVGKWCSRLWPDLIPPEVFTIGALVFLVFVVVNLLRFVLRAPKVTSEVLCAAISAYLLMGIAWAFVYCVVAQLSPEAFFFSVGTGRKMAGPEAIYFSFVTLSTIGYGDIIPMSPMSRMLAVIEATTGMFYMAVLISRLVALLSTQKHAEETGG